MAVQFIDLSVPMEQNPGELAPYGFEQTGHQEGADRFARQFNGSRKDFPGEEFLNMEMITASTHTGTHFDAPCTSAP